MNDTDPFEEDAAVIHEFQRDLESLLVNAFAKGAVVEGTWEISGSVGAVPEWTVEIVKSADAETEYDPDLIE